MDARRRRTLAPVLLLALGVAACAGHHRRSSGPIYHPVISVAFAGDVVYALRAGGLVAWTAPQARVRAIGIGRTLALAEDGSVAVTAVKEEGRTRLEVWILATRTRRFVHTFDDGVDRILAVSFMAVALLVTNPPLGPEEGIRAYDPPRSYAALWRLDSNTVTRVRGLGGGVGAFAMSADARRFACDAGGLIWSDTSQNRWLDVDLAPEWWPPPRPEAEERPFNAKPVHVFNPYDILSLRLAAGGAAVYVTYDGVEEGQGWRFDRWVPGGPLTRLAASEHGRGRLLAASPDGGLLVLGDDGQPATMRRPPGYQPQGLVAEASAVYATAAALSPDGARIATGHADGALRLWDARSGRLLAASLP